MKTDSIKATAESAEGTLFLGDDRFDPLEAGVRTRIRGFIEELLETELDAALGRDRYERPRLAETCGGGRAVKRAGYRHGHRARRVRRALAALFGNAVGKDTVSRVWRKVKGDWDDWNARSLKDEPIIRLILDGTVVRVRLDKKATSISLLVALGVRQDGQKVLLAVKNMGGESEAAWRAL